jgi:hypothetical protein
VETSNAPRGTRRRKTQSSQKARRVGHPPEVVDTTRRYTRREIPRRCAGELRSSAPLARNDNAKQQQRQKRRGIPRRCTGELRSPATLARNDNAKQQQRQKRRGIPRRCAGELRSSATLARNDKYRRGGNESVGSGLALVPSSREPEIRGWGKFEITARNGNDAAFRSSSGTWRRWGRHLYRSCGGKAETAGFHADLPAGRSPRFVPPAVRRTVYILRVR